MQEDMKYKTMTSTSKDENLKEKEWTGLRGYNRVTQVEPNLLIIEIGRLIPFMKGSNIRFFPLNMPCIEIGFINIIGIILEISNFGNYYELQVDDGTGILSVMFNEKRLEENKMKHVKAQNSNNNQRSTANVENIEKLKPGMYVHVGGFLSLNNYNKTIYNDFKNKGPEEIFWCSRPLLHGVKIRFISETEYYDKMCAWFNDVEYRYS